MTPEQQARARSMATYNAAADTYDHPALSFWDRFGRSTVERLSLRPGERVLDVCCGSGSSALPAAERVSPGGRVLAVDLADNLLELARAKAARRGLDNVEFRAGDLEEVAATAGGFDAVICVFGIFFVPDMLRAVRALWSATRPGGRLAITTWGAGVFEPADSRFWESVRAERPDLYKGFNPWDRIADAASLARLLDEAGIEGAVVVEEAARHEIADPADWWSIVLGSGYRGTLDQLDASARERVREANLGFARQAGLRSLQANVVYATARRA